jgi:hypothetical protein
MDPINAPLQESGEDANLVADRDAAEAGRDR